jgi:hypothetical protein
MITNEGIFNVLERIKTHLDHIHHVLPSQIVITVGQYAFNAMKGSKRFNGDRTPTLLHILHRREVDHKTIDVDSDSDSTLTLETVSEPHYWFDLHANLEEENRDFRDMLKEKIYDYQDETVAVGYLAEGMPSGVLPTLNTHLMQEGKSTLFLAIFPSMDYSSDALFNAYSSMGLLLLDEAGPIIFLDHSRLEKFVGVSRDGSLLTGGDAVKYLSEFLLEKKGLIRDFVRLSKSFKIDLFTVLMVSGASLEIYGSFRNILDITLEQPMLDFDLSTASLIYAIVRAPRRLKERLSKGHLELELNNWLKERANLDAPQICETIYVDEFGDRVDVVIFVGGFDTKRWFETLAQRISRFSRLIVDRELYNKEIWSKITDKLAQYSERRDRIGGSIRL